MICYKRVNIVLNTSAVVAPSKSGHCFAGILLRSHSAVAAFLQRHADFGLGSIIQQFHLRLLPSRTKGGFYRKLVAYGHVGPVDLELPWEVTDKVEMFKEHRY